MDQRECARLETLDGEPISLLGVKLSGDLRGLMFEASVEQFFCNPGEKNVEVVYSFPLPWGAVLLGVDVVLGGKNLTGAVVERKQAEARYEEAISEGNAAIMLEKNRDHSYSLNLGNLAAHEHCTITLRYAQTLQFEQHGLRLLIPTVIAPRYGDAQQDSGLLPHQAPSHSMLVDYAFALELLLHGDLAQARVASPSHPIGVVHGSTQSDTVLAVSLARQAYLDRDFVLVVDQLAHDSMAVSSRDSVAPGKVAVLASFCPRIAMQGNASTAVKILVDCSGSMAGDSINAAKRALQAIVLQLGAGDRFSLSRFGSTVEHRSRALWKVTGTARLAAQRWVGALQANLGGTQMETALKSTFGLAQTVSSDVLLVTDGGISAIDRTIASAKDSGHRLFIVGIGSSPAETHLRRLAEATGGACDFVAPGEAVEPAVLRMFARLRSPRLANLHIEWPAGSVPEWVSPLLPLVFDGDTVHVFALLGKAPAGQLRLLGEPTEDETPQVIGCATFAGELDATDTLSRMVAAVRLRATHSDDRSAIASDAAALAVAYQLVTDRTNFLLVHERTEGEKATDMPELQKVAQMTPTGWGGTGSVSFSRSQLDSSLPAVFRMSRSSPRSGDLGGDHFIPSFLRAASPRSEESAGTYQISSEYYSGLTPLGFCIWLQRNPVEQWPRTYQGLRDVGLGYALIEWLELEMAMLSDDGYAESTVVWSFVTTLVRFFEDGFPNEGGRDRLFWASLPLENSASGTSSDAQRINVLQHAMSTVLGKMQSDSWPDAALTISTATDFPDRC